VKNYRAFFTAEPQGTQRIFFMFTVDHPKTLADMKDGKQKALSASNAENLF
jgi:hypothetical protein